MYADDKRTGLSPWFWIRTVIATSLCLFVILTTGWLFVMLGGVVLAFILAGAFNEWRKSRVAVLAITLAVAVTASAATTEESQAGGGPLLNSCPVDTHYAPVTNRYTMESQPFGTDLSYSYLTVKICPKTKPGTLNVPDRQHPWFAVRTMFNSTQHTVTRSGETAGWVGVLWEGSHKCVSGDNARCYKTVWWADWLYQRTGGPQPPVGGVDTEWVRIRTVCESKPDPVRCDSQADQDSVRGDLDPHRAAHRLRVIR